MKVRGKKTSSKKKRTVTQRVTDHVCRDSKLLP